MGLEGFKKHALKVADFYRRQSEACVAAAEKHLTGKIYNLIFGAE